MSWHQSPVLAFDLETTGVDPLEARIVTWAMAHVTPTGEVTYTAGGIVNPGVPIDPDAATVHGITTERAEAEGAAPLAALEAISDVLERYPDAPVCAFNAAYDLTITHLEAQRHGHAALAKDLWSRPVIDPLVIDRAVDKYRRGARKLQPTCDLYGVALEDWHTAEADCLAAARLAYAIAARYPQACGPVDAVHSRQGAWRGEQARSLQAYFRRTNPAAVVDAGWPFHTGVAEVPA